jgi:DNA repair protein RadC
MNHLHQLSEISVSYQSIPKIIEPPVIVTSLDAYAAFREFFCFNTINIQEQFVVLYLNKAHRLIGGYKLSKGGITGTVADVRLILSVALKTLATAIIIAHNHPSNNLQPSMNDESVTRKIKKAADLMEIDLLDHLILSVDNYYSFGDNGLM